MYMIGPGYQIVASLSGGELHPTHPDSRADLTDKLDGEMFVNYFSKKSYVATNASIA